MCALLIPEMELQVASVGALAVNIYDVKVRVLKNSQTRQQRKMSFLMKASNHHLCPA